MKKTNLVNKGQPGFTLIELSIVLVIIGLIVGGVLVGQDLIKAAEIRATVSQYEKYNSEVNTFRNKYNGIPGDLACATAFNLGFTGGMGSPATNCGSPMTGGAGLGDGNGIIEGGAANATAATGETVIFWRDLTDANLIDGSYGTSLTTSASVTATGGTVGNYLPPAKAGRGNYWTVASSNGINYYFLTGFGTTPITSGTYSYSTTGGALTPVEAYNIDIKVDDGAPNTGIVQARGTASGNPFANLNVAGAAPAVWNTTATDGDCLAGSGTVNSDPANIYNRNINAGGNTPSCSLRMRFN